MYNKCHTHDCTKNAKYHIGDLKYCGKCTTKMLKNMPHLKDKIKEIQE